MKRVMGVVLRKELDTYFTFRAVLEFLFCNFAIENKTNELDLFARVFTIFKNPYSDEEPIYDPLGLYKNWTFLLDNF